jgi:hypothetical protein
MSTNLQKHGLKAALNWYKLGVTGLIAKDDAGMRILPVLPRDNHEPVLFRCASRQIRG